MVSGALMSGSVVLTDEVLVSVALEVWFVIGAAVVSKSMISGALMSGLVVLTDDVLPMLIGDVVDAAFDEDEELTMPVISVVEV